MRLAFDIEADNLLFDVTKAWCIVAIDVDTGATYQYGKEDIYDGLEQLSKADTLIAHNGIGYDLPALKKLYGFDYKGDVVDTLILSRLRYPTLESHSLSSWGERLGISKLEFNDFSYYSPDMLEYCTRDVQVLVKLFKHFESKMSLDKDYIKLEQDILAIQTEAEEYGVTFDYDGAMRLSTEIAHKMDDIQNSLADSLGYYFEVKKHKLKKDGTLSHHAVRLLKTLESTYPEFPTNCEIDNDTGFSTILVPEKITLDTKKLLVDKLLENGWIPTMQTEKGSPKIADKGEVCSNLPEEFKDVGTYFILKHRKGLIDGFFKHVRSDGKIPAEANTLGAITGRYTHRKIANFPAVRSMYGQEIRGLFGVDKGRVQVGCDLSGIEARMLAHYMDDPDFTAEVLDGDIHAANQIAAGLPTRDAAKTFFYAFLYTAGDGKIGELVNGDAEDGARVKAQFLNKLPSLAKLIEEKQAEASKGYIISLDGRPIVITKSVSRFGKKEYDTRKALNSLLQSSATIFFKRWVWFIDKYTKERGLDANLMILYHDEIQSSVAAKDVDAYKQVLHDALKATDDYYKVKCRNDIEIKTGSNWRDCH